MDGMAHFSSLNALHRDLKAANIFLHFPDREKDISVISPFWLKEVDLSKEPFLVKIGDLGFSK